MSVYVPNKNAQSLNVAILTPQWQAIFISIWIGMMSITRKNEKEPTWWWLEVVKSHRITQVMNEWTLKSILPVTFAFRGFFRGGVILYKKFEFRWKILNFLDDFWQKNWCCSGQFLEFYLKKTPQSSLSNKKRKIERFVVSSSPSRIFGFLIKLKNFTTAPSVSFFKMISKIVESINRNQKFHKEIIHSLKKSLIITFEKTNHYLDMDGTAENLCSYLCIFVRQGISIQEWIRTKSTQSATDSAFTEMI